MSVAEDFVTYLNTQTGVTDIVGSRIHQAPAHARLSLPYVVFRRRGQATPPTLGGGDGDTTETQFDVECRAATQDGAEDLADAVHTALNGKAWLTWGSRRVLGVFVNDQDDDYEFIPSGSSAAERTATLYVQVFSR